MKPLAVLLILAIVALLIPCLFAAMWCAVRGVRRGNRRSATLWSAVSAAIVAFSGWALYEAAPKGGRTIGQLELSDGQTFLVRHYRYAWLDPPRIRFYARDADGGWTSYILIWELVDPDAVTLAIDEAGQRIDLGTAGTYQIARKSYINIDGSPAKQTELPAGVEPGEEDPI